MWRLYDESKCRKPETKPSDYSVSGGRDNVVSDIRQPDLDYI